MKNIRIDYIIQQLSLMRLQRKMTKPRGRKLSNVVIETSLSESQLSLLTRFVHSNDSLIDLVSKTIDSHGSGFLNCQSATHDFFSAMEAQLNVQR